MFPHFVFVLFSFCARKFPSKYVKNLGHFLLTASCMCGLVFAPTFIKGFGLD